MTSVTPEQTDIPQPVTWAINVCSEETQRSKKILADISAMGKRIIATQKLLAQLVEDSEAAELDYRRCSENAKVAREMAETACAKYGWTLPEVPAEAPLLETQTWQAVPTDEPLSPRWSDLLGQRVTVTYTDGAYMTGDLEEVSADRLTINCPDGFPGESFRPGVEHVASVVPAPPAAETTAPDQPAAQDTKEAVTS